MNKYKDNQYIIKLTNSFYGPNSGPSYVTTGRTLGEYDFWFPPISHRSLHDPIAVLCPFSHICSHIHELYLSDEPKCGRR
ncbi:hypothetical protein ACJIZ3_001924 [Penstemon smallii]|uniref:Uncharacterized protein n=1 Tax=Penstemon smallii TaxID=265156 RepID=A0ABD3U514_9LAMI